MGNPYAPRVHVPDSSEARVLGGVKNADDTEKDTTPAIAVVDGSVREVSAWIGDDKERALAAREAELKEDHPRKGILNYVNDLLSN